MDKSNYAIKKEQKRQMISDALNLLETTKDLSKLTYNKFKDKIKSGNANTIKSVVNSINISQNINDNKTNKKVSL